MEVFDEERWFVLSKGYFFIQTCDDGYDYTFYDRKFRLLDGGQLDRPDLTLEEAKEEILQNCDLDIL